MNEVPQKVGFYWAKPNKEHKYFTLFVEVTGKAPFLHAIAWSIDKHVQLNIPAEGLRDDIVWGPEIDWPDGSWPDFIEAHT